MTGIEYGVNVRVIWDLQEKCIAFAGHDEGPAIYESDDTLAEFRTWMSDEWWVKAYPGRYEVHECSITRWPA